MKRRNKIHVYQLDEINQQDSTAYLFDLAKEELTHADEIQVPHRHDHYCCFLLEEGTIDMFVDFIPVQLNNEVLLISYPGQIHKVISSKNCKGQILVFDAKLTDERARRIIEDSLTKLAAPILNHEDQDWFRKLFTLIGSVIRTNNKGSFHDLLIRSLLDSFLFRATSLLQLQEKSNVHEYSARNIEITKKFRQAVQEQFKTIKKPSQYAEQLNFSLSYLNDTVKAVTGFSLTYFIRQEVVSEAQRLLHYSEFSIKEIAYQLGYDDVKYFIRLFGKGTGKSPTEFRKSNNKAI